MTRDDIIRMAREAGFETGTALCEVVVRHSNGSWVGINAELIEFAALIAAAEREACAKMCEEIEGEYRDRESLRYAELRTDAQTGASDCAYRIRARGDT